jgi:uncharacterized protein YcfL
MKRKLVQFVLLLLVVSCKTYTISPENFKKQFVEDNANTLTNVRIDNPLSTLSDIKYQANSLKYLNVYDKNGQLNYIRNSPSTEIRVTLINGKKKIFYLDTVVIENDTLKGSKSRLLGISDKVPFNHIVKIEVQDGKKNYYNK